MLSSIFNASAALALLHIFHSASAATPTSSAAASTTSLVLNAMTAEGCYSSSADMVNQGTWTWQTSGYCQPICVGLGMPVMGLSNGTTCWCGSQLPSTSDKLSDASCNIPCVGYPDDKCGGANAWTVLLSGMTSIVGTQGDSNTPGVNLASNVATSRVAASSTTTTTTSSTSANTPTTTTTPVASVAPVTVTVGGSTIVRTMAVTAVASPTSTSTASTTASHSSNKAAIAAGVVVGLVAIGAIVGGGIFFYLRRRRSQAAATPSGHRRNTSLHAFAPPPPPSSVPRPLTVNMNDSRLDPGIMQEKRQSGVSVFADNFDYSRRILKVSNPDRL